jgi:[lysine-biosynthesis-protein LysW]--L-2-aminoadipate ligase
VTPEIDRLSRAAARAVGGGILAIDLLERLDGELLVNEVNYTMEFRNSVPVTGVPIPDLVVDHVLQVAEQAEAVRSATV